MEIAIDAGALRTGGFGGTGRNRPVQGGEIGVFRKAIRAGQVFPCPGGVTHRGMENDGLKTQIRAFWASGLVGIGGTASKSRFSGCPHKDTTAEVLHLAIALGL